MRNRTMSTRTLFSALAALALTTLGQAQNENPPGPASPSSGPAGSEAVTVQGAQPAAAPASRDKDTLSVDFPDEEIKTILRNVADLFELNIVVPDTLTGKTSIKLRDVTWRQIFKTVLDPVGFTYIEEGNIIKIVSNESLQAEPAATEVFILNNAKAADIKPTVDGLVDATKGGKILIDARSNALVITERPSQMGRIRNIIEQLDKATDQVMIESKFVEVTDRDVRDIGVRWDSLQNFQLGVGNLTQTVTRNRGQSYQNGSGANSNSSATTNSGNTSSTTTNNTTGTNNSSTTTNTGAVSTSTTQSNSGSQLLPVTTTDANGNTTTTYQVVPISSTGTTTTSSTPSSQTNSTNGTTGSSTNSVATTITDGLASTASSALNSLMNIGHTGDLSRATTAIFTASDFNLVLSALKSLNSVKVVSNPTVVTLNNTEAILNIGEEFPVPSYTYNSERGSFEVSGFNYKPIGVILKVTPQVNARGVIKMALEPEVSQRNGATSFGGAGGASIPIVATRKVKTQISLQSGYTAGIGGLITTQRNHTDTKVPLLGDIPGLGRLFKHKAVDDQSANLLIFITARTVTAEGATPEEVFDPRAIQGAGLTREELPGYRAAKGTDLFAQPAVGKK
jgi:type II secretory pathway component GspD/PulD (secretin)